MPLALFWLKVSRPGLWFQTLWLYTLPTARLPEILSSGTFWLGLIYVTFPLNFLVYGWNDIVDYENDRENPRKDSFLFGARGSREQLARLPLVIAVAQVPFLLAFLCQRNGLALLSLFGQEKREKGDRHLLAAFYEYCGRSKLRPGARKKGTSKEKGDRHLLAAFYEYCGRSKLRPGGPPRY
jgi:hypothetical protein